MREPNVRSGGVVIDELLDGSRQAVLLVGRAGTGKAGLVRRALLGAHELGLPVQIVRGHRLTRGEPFEALEELLPLDLLERLIQEPTRFDRIAARRFLVERLDPGLLVVEDAQWIDAASLDLIAAAAAHLGGEPYRVLVSHRPRSTHRELAALDEALLRESQPIVLTTVPDAAAMRLLGAELPQLGDCRLDRLVDGCGGDVRLLETVLRVGQESEDSLRRWFSGGTLPPQLVEHVRSRVGRVSGEARELLLALAFGAAANGDELGDLLSVSDRLLTSAVEELDDEGLLRADSAEIIPIVAEATTLLEPPVERRRHHRRFAAVLAGRGGSDVSRAEHLQASGATRSELAAAAIDAADELLDNAPELALSWLDRAAESGATHSDLAARRVEAHVRIGNPSDALRSAEPLFRQEAPRRLRGLTHAATAFVQGRRSVQAASILRQIAPRVEGEARELTNSNASICLLDAGRLTEAGTHASLGGRHESTRVAATDPTIEVAHLLATAWAAMTEGHMTRATGSVAEAIDLELLAVGEHHLPWSAAACAPMLAVFGADLHLARRFARRASSAPATTESRRRTRELTNAFVDALSGHGPQLDIDDDEWQRLGPMDRLIGVAAESASARRANDLQRLGAVTDRILEVLLRPPSLFVLPAYGEVMIAAARLGATQRLREARALRDRALGEAGGTEVVAIFNCWVDLQSMVASEDTSQLEVLADRLSDLQPADRRLTQFVASMRTWARVVSRSAEPAEILTASSALQETGRPWEATRLVGGAALRLDDEHAARDLLATARELRADLPHDDAAAPLSSKLSAREYEVAQLLVSGHTYKQIGGRLYISPKTVEHHVARIRQRLGASSRPEMLDLLRTSLSAAAAS